MASRVSMTRSEREAYNESILGCFEGAAGEVSIADVIARLRRPNTYGERQRVQRVVRQLRAAGRIPDAVVANKHPTNEVIEARQETILELLEEDWPQSTRNIYYRLTGPNYGIASVIKNDKGYRAIQRRMVAMREDGTLLYEWVKDSTREGILAHTFEDGAAAIRNAAGWYRVSPWKYAAAVVQVWCESRSLAGVLEDDCNDMVVDLFPCGGYASLTLAYDGAQRIKRLCEKFEVDEVVIVFVGDYDKDGLQIPIDVEKKLTKHLGGTGIDLTFNRIAVNEDQIAAMNLPKKPPKTDDAKAGFEFTVEAESIPAKSMRRMVRDAVEYHLPEGAKEAAKAQEARDRRWILRAADEYKSKHP